MAGNQKNKNYIIRWTPEFAYAVGLLTADGSLSKDGRHFDLTSKDTQLLKTFKKCLNLDNKISPKKGTYSDKCYHVQFGNVKLYKYLLTIGLMPNKTKKIREIKIPTKYFFDFLRGFFDGDGSCYSYWDKRWPNSFMFYTYFISSNHLYLKWLQDRIYRLIRIKGSIDKATSAYQLQYAKRDSQVVWSKMYYRKNLPCLLRKQRKIEKILKIQARVMELARHASLRGL